MSTVTMVAAALLDESPDGAAGLLLGRLLLWFELLLL
jgi:hypothetical protein